MDFYYSSDCKLKLGYYENTLKVGVIPCQYRQVDLLVPNDKVPVYWGGRFYYTVTIADKYIKPGVGVEGEIYLLGVIEDLAKEFISDAFHACYGENPSDEFMTIHLSEFMGSPAISHTVGCILSSELLLSDLVDYLYSFLDYENLFTSVILNDALSNLRSSMTYRFYGTHLQGIVYPNSNNSTDFYFYSLKGLGVPYTLSKAKW